MKKICLGISFNAVPNWTAEDAIRDIIQNWLDNPKMDRSYEISGSVISFTNSYTELPPSVLLTGHSTKRHDPDSRGHHGDGLKSAIAVLLREGYSVDMYNGSVIWSAHVKWSVDFQEDCVYIVESDNLGQKFSMDGFTIQIYKADGSNLCSSLKENIVDNTLILQPKPEEEPLETSYGSILLDNRHKGRIYCGGLYVSTLSNLKYGYDFIPKHLKLDRDRRAVESFDIQWITKEMWAEIDDAEKTIKNLCTNSDDTSFLHHAQGAIKEAVIEGVMKHYHGVWNGAVLADDYDDSVELLSQGYQNVVITGNSALNKIVASTKEYQNVLGSTVKINPITLLDDFKESWYNNLCVDIGMMDDYDKMTVQISTLIK